jgi:hypothetical protein
MSDVMHGPMVFVGDRIKRKPYLIAFLGDTTVSFPSPPLPVERRRVSSHFPPLARRRNAILDLDDSFLFEAKRNAQKTTPWSLNGMVYGVDATLVGEQGSHCVTIRPPHGGG